MSNHLQKEKKQTMKYIHIRYDPNFVYSYIREKRIQAET